MHLHVYIHDHRLLVLLDSSSTNNFINIKVMCPIQLKTSDHPSMWVAVANGDDRVPCEGVAHNIAISIVHEKFSISYYGIDLGDFNIILGVDFLRTLGHIMWDFKDLSMAF